MTDPDEDKTVGVRPRIEVLPDGPYRVTGDVRIEDSNQSPLQSAGTWYLCRCGGSRNKPFCDATHGLKGFVGTETASRDPSADRRDHYAAAAVTVLDDRSRCAHFGQCTDRLPGVFRASEEPFVDPDSAADEDIVEVVRGCPSGALAFTRESSNEPEESPHDPRIAPIVDGPYRVEGAVLVIAADGTPYEVRERQTLCRCGHSQNKPFCDGSHWYAGFRDPVPPEEQVTVPTLYDALGGGQALEALTAAFYDGILGEPDPLLEPVFRGMEPDTPSTLPSGSGRSSVGHAATPSSTAGTSTWWQRIAIVG